jgi:hypothetical protein
MVMLLANPEGGSESALGHLSESGTDGLRTARSAFDGFANSIDGTVTPIRGGSGARSKTVYPTTSVSP